jgi:transcriptional regulator with XRE-family HTH domain
MNLKQYRKSLGLTQNQMATALEIAQPALCRSEKKWPNVSVFFLQKIAEVYGAQIVVDGDSGVTISNYPRVENDNVDDVII